MKKSPPNANHNPLKPTFMQLSKEQSDFAGLTDEQVWECFLWGNFEALSALFRRHATHLHHYGKQYTMDKDTIQDVIQELFTQLLLRRERLNPTASVKNYLRKSLRHLLQHKKSSVPLVSWDKEDLEHWFSDYTPDSHFQIEQAELQQSRQQLIKMVLKNLSTHQQKIIRLRFYEEWSYEEIMVDMNISYQSARNLLQTALKNAETHLRKLKNKKLTVP
jgi:RNA polymerase sigma-70 factor (ECF subfamily)